MRIQKIKNILKISFYFGIIVLVFNGTFYYTIENRSALERWKNDQKKDIYDKIVHALSIFIDEIETKAKNNLLDDNVFSEDFIKDLLNVCMGWNLVNLNEDVNGFPGIDLGDKERHIGVQITSTKTSKKIIDSLDTIVDNKVDSEFNEIYF